MKQLFFLCISLSFYALNAADNTRDIESLRASLSRTKCCEKYLLPTICITSVPQGLASVIVCCLGGCTMTIPGNPLAIAGTTLLSTSLLSIFGSLLLSNPATRRAERIEAQIFRLTQQPTAARMEAVPLYDFIRTQPTVVLPMDPPPAYYDAPSTIEIESDRATITTLDNNG